LKESQIQRAILDYLAAERIPAWRMNSGAVSGEHNGKRRFFRFGQKGMADILASFREKDSRYSRFLWIEVKAPGKDLAVSQWDFMTYVQENGMTYIPAWSVDDVEKWIKDHR
jgi:hypothetical protein